MEEATGAPSSLADWGPKRLRASGRDGGKVMTQPPSPLTMLFSRHTSGAIAHRANENELTRSVRDAGLGEGGHAGVTGQRCAHQQNGDARARGFAEPHIEVEQRVETKFAQ